MNSLPFGQLKSFLKILIGVQYENIVLFHIPPYTPEMNPIEQIWKEIRKRGFRNEVFATLEKIVDRLCDTICSLTPNTIFSITGRDWIIKAFNQVLVLIPKAIRNKKRAMRTSPAFVIANFLADQLHVAIRAFSRLQRQAIADGNSFLFGNGKIRYC